MIDYVESMITRVQSTYETHNKVTIIDIVDQEGRHYLLQMNLCL